MKLKVQKRLAAALFKCSEKRVWFDEDRLSDIKEAITKQDIKGLVIDGAIRLKPTRSTSKGRARKKRSQKSRGMQKGPGSRKGGLKARTPKKLQWMNKIRVQREFLRSLREGGLLQKGIYQNLYSKSKGGFFRSKRHIKLYIEEHNIIQKTVKTGK
ncbi:MAG: 50S ribosomal protein L19e [Nanoarchaeota archaeon]|nr:50S ribosomal protein L19e [Nanoarchaeota archaeon]